MTEEEIHQAHKDRVAVLVAKYGSTLAIPHDEIMHLHGLNRQDWVAYVERRDGRRRSKAERIADDVAEAERALEAFTRNPVRPDDPRIGKP
jgi:hypothetical protein